jgi:hypothetical protein
MSMRQSDDPNATAGAPKAVAQESEAEPRPAGLSLEEYLPASSPTPARAGANEGAPGMRTARVARVEGRKAQILLRGKDAPVEADIAPEVDPELVADAHASGDAVLVEQYEGEPPLVVGILQTKKPREIHLRAATVHIEGDQEVLLRSGRGAVRIREDGDIEILGSRISAASRGLFRIVGRILRLN